MGVYVRKECNVVSGEREIRQRKQSGIRHELRDGSLHVVAFVKGGDVFVDSITYLPTDAPPKPMGDSAAMATQNATEVLRAQQLQGEPTDQNFVRGPAVDTTTMSNTRFRSFQPGVSRPNVDHRPLGWSVWRWPEFQAFARRLGIDVGTLPTRGLIINLPLDNVVFVEQEYLCDDMTKGESDDA